MFDLYGRQPKNKSPAAAPHPYRTILSMALKLRAGSWRRGLLSCL